MKRIIVLIFLSTFLTLSVYAGSDGKIELSKKSEASVKDCFEGLNRGIFTFNQALDAAVFEPLAKGYRYLPSPIRTGTSNAVSNISTLLSIPNNVLQGDIGVAGKNTVRFIINSSIGILGLFDFATPLGFDDYQKEDFGQTLGRWGTNSGCYFVLPILGPTTVRDSIGLVGNIFIDPIYHITHNSEIHNGLLGNDNYSEHSYYYYRGTSAVDFRSKNIESFDSLEKNSIDLYATVKSLYIQERNKKIANSESIVGTQDSDDWEEIDTN